MKLMITFLMLFSISNGFSQVTSETTAPATTLSNSSTDMSFWEKIKKAPVGLVLSNEIVANTKTTSLTGITNVTDAIFSYKLSDKNALKITSGLAVADTNNTNTETTYNGATLIFSRSGLLGQDKYGVDMYASLRYKALPGGTDVPGYASIRTGFSRTFSPIFSAVTELRWEEYVRDTSGGSLTRRRFALILGPTFQVTEKLGISPTTVFSESIKGPTTKDTNYLNFAPSIDYTFDKKFSGSLYWDSYPLKSGDDSFFAANWYSTGSIGLYLSYSIL